MKEHQWDGKGKCTVCHVSRYTQHFRLLAGCPGYPFVKLGDQPKDIVTLSELQRVHHRKPAPQQEPVAVYATRNPPYYRPMYLVSDALPRRKASEALRQALERGRETQRICEMCQSVGTKRLARKKGAQYRLCHYCSKAQPLHDQLIVLGIEEYDLTDPTIPSSRIDRIIDLCIALINASLGSRTSASQVLSWLPLPPRNEEFIGYDNNVIEDGKGDDADAVSIPLDDPEHDPLSRIPDELHILNEIAQNVNLSYQGLCRLARYLPYMVIQSDAWSFFLISDPHIKQMDETDLARLAICHHLMHEGKVKNHWLSRWFQRVQAFPRRFIEFNDPVFPLEVTSGVGTMSEWSAIVRQPAVLYQLSIARNVPSDDSNTNETSVDLRLDCMKDGKNTEVFRIKNPQVQFG